MSGKRLKVAFAMGGGVSLGAFAGGAIAEVLRQLDRNLNRDRYASVEIDVLSGASAGGMTVGVLARSLADSANESAADAVQRVHDNMHRAWVDDIDIVALIPDPEMNDRPSLLDRGAVDAIARKVFHWPEGSPPKPQYLGKRVCLGVTLLNYNGIAIRGSDVEDLRDWMTTTLFEDYRVFCLDFLPVERARSRNWLSYEAGELAENDTWSTIAATTIAGGAFPLAFEPVVLRRRAQEFGPFWKDMFAPGVASFPFTHGDGGAFNNEPLREAMRLIGYQDTGEDPATFDRVLFTIDPHVTGDSHDLSLRFHVSQRIDPDYGLFDGEDVVSAGFAGRIRETGERLLTAIRGQAAFKDYLAADKINNRLRWRNRARDLVLDIASAIAPEDADQLAAQSEGALRGVLQEKRDASFVPGQGLGFDEEMERVWLELEETPEAAEVSAHTKRLACSMLALLDQVADLRRKSEVTIYAVAPTWFVPPGGQDRQRVELAGEFLSAFGGFFDRSYRQHDFDLGRAVAGSVMSRRPASGPDLELQILRDVNDREGLPTPLDPNVNSSPLAKKRFADRLGHVAASLVRDSFSNLLVRLGGPALAAFFVRRVVKLGKERSELAILRIVVEAEDPKEDVFFLAGQKGDAGERRPASGQREVELVTVVRFSLPGDPPRIEGPHVLERGAGRFVEVCEDHVLRGDASWAIALPSLQDLRDQMNLGLPIFEATVKWADRTKRPWAGAWRPTEGLTPLEDRL